MTMTVTATMTATMTSATMTPATITKMKYIFWLSAALVGYSYFGYPVWLWLRSRWSPRPIRRGSIQPTVSAVMVVRNEEAVLARKLDNLLKLDYPAEKLDVVVVSDGSTDRTNAILADYARDPRVRFLTKTAPQGKAAGLNDAIKLATADVLLFTDARQPIESGALRLLAENFADPDVGAASGELMLGNPSSGETGKGMGLYWRVEKKVREFESASGSVVGATGAIYCARRSLLESSALPGGKIAADTIPTGTILDDVLIPMQIVRQKSRVIFDSRARAWDSPDLGDGREFSRKVRTLSGNYQLLQLAPWLMSSQNPIRFEFVSHKLSRLAVPFALLTLLLASIFLPQPLYRVALYGQLAFYALSLIAIAGLNIGPISRLADPARTFVVLNSAAAVAFVNFVTGRKAVWVR
jgi:poly-beta-1,6-N-acetyl-D-glucosamine synthase